jgi:major membrane immunogen (membrane-anchored lipoprotein)
MKMLVLVLLLLIAACGYSSRDVEAIGQVKRVAAVTPIICPNFKALDLSLGVMRNGVGSMSHEDIDVLVESEDVAAKLKASAEQGKIVKITYDMARLTFCVPERVVRTVQVLE